MHRLPMERARHGRYLVGNTKFTAEEDTKSPKFDEENSKTYVSGACSEFGRSVIFVVSKHFRDSVNKELAG